MNKLELTTQFAIGTCPTRTGDVPLLSPPARAHGTYTRFSRG